MKRKFCITAVLSVALLLVLLVCLRHAKKSNNPEISPADRKPAEVNTACIRSIQVMALQWEAIASREARDPEAAITKWQEASNLTDNPDTLIRIKTQSCAEKAAHPALGDPQADCGNALELAERHLNEIEPDNVVLAFLTNASIKSETDRSLALNLLDKADRICDRKCAYYDNIQAYRSDWQSE